MVEYFLEKDKGKETISLQRGLNHSVRGNCLELVKKFVELGTDKDGKVTLDIDAAARWLKATKSNGNEEAKIADFLDRLSPGCTLRGACDVMSIIFGNSQMPSSDESFKNITEKISMVGREYPEPEQKDERLLAASEVMDEIAESTGLPKELIENLKTQMREIANLPDDEKKQEAIQEMFKGIFGLSSADLHHYDPDFHPNL